MRKSSSQRYITNLHDIAFSVWISRRVRARLSIWLDLLPNPISAVYYPLNNLYTHPMTYTCSPYILFMVSRLQAALGSFHRWLSYYSPVSNTWIHRRFRRHIGVQPGFHLFFAKSAGPFAPPHALPISVFLQPASMIYICLNAPLFLFLRLPCLNFLTRSESRVDLDPLIRWMDISNILKCMYVSVYVVFFESHRE